MHSVFSTHQAPQKRGAQHEGNTRTPRGGTLWKTDTPGRTAYRGGIVSFFALNRSPGGRTPYRGHQAENGGGSTVYGGINSVETIRRPRAGVGGHVLLVSFGVPV